MFYTKILCAALKQMLRNWKRLLRALERESVVLKCIEHVRSTLWVHVYCGNPITYSTVHMYHISNKILEHARRISEKRKAGYEIKNMLCDPRMHCIIE